MAVMSQTGNNKHQEYYVPLARGVNEEESQTKPEGPDSQAEESQPLLRGDSQAKCKSFKVKYCLCVGDGGSTNRDAEDARAGAPY